MPRVHDLVPHALHRPSCRGLVVDATQHASESTLDPRPPPTTCVLVSARVRRRPRAFWFLRAHAQAQGGAERDSRPPLCAHGSTLVCRRPRASWFLRGARNRAGTRRQRPTCVLLSARVRRRPRASWFLCAHAQSCWRSTSTTHVCPGFCACVRTRRAMRGRRLPLCARGSTLVRRRPHVSWFLRGYARRGAGRAPTALRTRQGTHGARAPTHACTRTCVRSLL